MTKEIHEQPRGGRRHPARPAQARRHARASTSCGSTDEELRAIDRSSSSPAASAITPRWWPSTPSSAGPGCPTEVDIAERVPLPRPGARRPHPRRRRRASPARPSTPSRRCARRAAGGRRCWCVSNVVDSSMAREADGVLYTRAGPEIGVASTKCHVAQIVALELLALNLAQVRGTLAPRRSRRHLRRAAGPSRARWPTALGRAEGRRRRWPRRSAGARDFFFLGRGVGYPVALEGALKLKEISYLRAEGYPAGRAQARARSRSSCRARSSSGWPPAAASVGEDAGQRRRGARAAGRRWCSWPTTATRRRPRSPTTCSGCRPPDRSSPRWSTSCRSSSSPTASPGSTGNDVDRPRNLAKTVTVE